MKTQKLLRHLLLILGIASLFALPPLAEADEQEPRLAQVVYHADFADPRRLSAMLTNVFNMVTTYENEFTDYDVRIVFLSHGIRFLTEDPLKGTSFAVDDETAKLPNDLITRLQTLHDMQHVNLSLCNITREAIGLDKEKLIPGVTLVTSGVVEIAKLQSQGFAYLKVE